MAITNNSRWAPAAYGVAGLTIGEFTLYATAVDPKVDDAFGLSIWAALHHITAAGTKVLFFNRDSRMPTSTDGDLPIEIEFVADPTEDMNRFFIENVDPFNGIEALPGFEHSADTIEYLNAKAAGYQLPVIDKHVKSTVRPWHPPHPAD